MHRSIMVIVPDNDHITGSGDIDVDVHFAAGKFVEMDAYLNVLTQHGFSVNKKVRDRGESAYVVAECKDGLAGGGDLEITVYGPEFKDIAVPQLPPADTLMAQAVAKQRRDQADAERDEELRRAVDEHDADEEAADSRTSG